MEEAIVESMEDDKSVASKAAKKAKALDKI